MASKDKGKRGSFLVEDYEPIVVDKWDGSAVKNALDDMIKQMLKNEYGYAEDHNIVDKRLFLCTMACAFSIFAVVYDYLFPFPASCTVLATCSISYFILMGVITLFSMYYEGQIFMVAIERNAAGVGPENFWRVKSSLPRFSHMYKLELEYVCDKESRKASLEKSIGMWITEEGRLMVELLFNDLNSLHADVQQKKTN